MFVPASLFTHLYLFVYLCIYLFIYLVSVYLSTILSISIYLPTYLLVCNYTSVWVSCIILSLNLIISLIHFTDQHTFFFSARERAQGQQNSPIVAAPLKRNRSRRQKERSVSFSSYVFSSGIIKVKCLAMPFEDLLFSGCSCLLSAAPSDFFMSFYCFIRSCLQ